MDQRTTELNTGGVYSATGTRTSEQIRSDIEARRAEMEVLATCLRDKLSPQEIANEVKRSLQSRGTRMASSVAHSVRENPMPWLLIAGGLGWLIKESRSRSTSSSLGYYGYPTDSLGYGTSTYGTTVSGSSLGSPSASLRSPMPYSEPGGFVTGAGFGTVPEEHGVVDTAREKVSDVTERAADAIDRGKDKAVHAKDVLVDKTVHAKDVMAEKAHHALAVVGDKTTVAKERLADVGHRTALQTRLLSERARLQASTTANESPLLFALGLLGVGALIGLAIPTSRREDELMGPTRDHLLEQAKHKGQEVAHKVSRIAEVATTEATRRVSGEQQGDAGQKIVSAVEGAVSAARREAERQGITSTGGDGLTGGSRSTSGSTGLSSGVSSGTLTGTSAGMSGMPSGSPSSTTLRTSSSGASPSSVTSPGSTSSSSPTRSTSGSSSGPSGVSSRGIAAPGSPTSSSSPVRSTSGSSVAGASPGTSPSRSGSGLSSGSISSSSSGSQTPGPSQISSPGSSSDRRGQSSSPERSDLGDRPKGPRR